MNSMYTCNKGNSAIKLSDYYLLHTMISLTFQDAVIFGIWFYEKEKCELVSKCIDRLVKDTEKRMNQRNKALNSSSGESKKGTDLSSLLSNAASKEKSR